MTPNATAIAALRKARKMSIRELARLAALHHTTVSRIERGQPEATADTIRQIAAALAVSPADITRGDDMATKAKPRPLREVPPPTSEKGLSFHYTPEEIEREGFLPWTARVIKEKVRVREIEHCGSGPGGRITLTGRQINTINARLEVPLLAETKPSPKQSVKEPAA